MFWNITDEELLAAQTGDATAERRIYLQAMPVCVRMATTLAGRSAAGNEVGQMLIKRAPAMLETFRDAAEAARWFAHQTVLLQRQCRRPADLKVDTLLTGVGGPDALQYRALINGLRKLPDQQQEAFLLTVAQGWNGRWCAVAMDCSNTAVATHLAEANRHLKPMTGAHFDALCGYIRQVHESLPVDLPQYTARISSRYKRRQLLLAARHTFAWGLTLLLVAAVVLAVIIIVSRIEI